MLESNFDEFKSRLCDIANRHMPSSHTFFENFSSAPFNVVSDPDFLGDIYFYYQAAMHTTRVMVYFLPNLNYPNFRKRKLKIYIFNSKRIESESV